MLSCSHREREPLDNSALTDSASLQAVSQWEYELFVRPDLNAPRYRLWFHFQVKSGVHFAGL